MTQPDLYGSSRSAPRRPLGVHEFRGELVREFRRWVPVLCALGLLAQVSLSGLRPALRESARLDHVERTLVLRRAELVQDAERLELLRAAQRDPVYLERERRQRLDPAHAPAGAPTAD